MLKKSKRTLSLILALVMLCSAMSIMAFAADGGESVTLTGNLAGRFSFNVDSEHISYITVNVGGYCYPEEGYIVWTQMDYAFSGDLVDFLGVGNIRSNGMTCTIPILFERNDDDPINVANVFITVNADGRVSMQLVNN